MTNYRLIQVTNSDIGAVAASALVPLGIMTRKVIESPTCDNTFVLTTSANNALYVQEAGFYKISYNGYLTVGAAGTITLQLLINGVVMSTATVTVSAAGTYLVTFVFMTRAFNNCSTNSTNLPLLIQLNNAGVALTGGVSNLIVERVYS